MLISASSRRRAGRAAAIAGLKPDVALVASMFANQIHNFTPRLLKALSYPKVILPTHWDHFEKPFSERPQDLRTV